MKKHIKLFEEFISNPAEEVSLKKQFMTNPVTGNIPVTHSVSQIVSDESGIHVQVGEPTTVIAVVAVEPKETKK